jgi:mono/diheme cytochrome c family protein
MRTHSSFAMHIEGPMRRGLLASSIALAALLAANATSTWAQQTDQSKAGHALASQICAQCHAVDKQSSSSPVAAAPRFEDVANSPGITATALKAFFQTSHRTMPNVILTADQMDGLVAYILSLKN